MWVGKITLSKILIELVCLVVLEELIFYSPVVVKSL